MLIEKCVRPPEGMGEDSLLEYGPGIVRKLRSRYQSLALRHSHTGRPTLRRAASLENSLDTLDDPQPNIKKTEDLPPVPRERSSLQNTRNGESQRERGRSGNVNDRRDRMRRARSVEALHRPPSGYEEDILSKVKNLVEPKEKIVIIEVSRSMGGKDGDNKGVNSNSNNRPPLVLPPAPAVRQLGRNSSAQQLLRSLSSPEHELPPPDIVRDTAKIFEKNSENRNRRLQWPLTTFNHSNATNCSNNKSPEVQQYKGSSGVRQIGVIRPTILSPTSVPNNPLHLGNLGHLGKKPPLSPKPVIFTSPKMNHEEETKKTNGHVSNLSNERNDKIRPPLLKKQSLLIEDKDKPPLIQNLKSPEEPVKEFVPKTRPRFVPELDNSSDGAEFTTVVLKKAIVEAKSPPAPSTIPTPILKPVLSPVNQPTGSILKQSSPPPNTPIILKSSLSHVNKTAAPSPPTTPSIMSNVLKSSSNGRSPETHNNQNNQNMNNNNNNNNVVRGEDPKRGFVVKKKSPETRMQIPSEKNDSKNNNSVADSVVFNFTRRDTVPDYIEDDGYYAGTKVNLEGTVTDETDDGDVLDKMAIFEGANVIINGKSSMQKKPKSQKLSISFNEGATKTFEYPSEASILGDSDEENLLVGHKSPNVISPTGSGLGSYTPSKMGENYELGSYVGRHSDAKEDKKADDPRLIEDYLKPETEGTTWSSEISADILF